MNLIKTNPCVLGQNSSEVSAGRAYFECHNFDLGGPGRVERCELKRRSLEIDVEASNSHLTVLFNEPDQNTETLDGFQGSF
ncbi:MAG TPA: hypothetical protein VLX61_11000 [Anaerolineales bacterium]|nr:hypothetical protein [Anaerolineales bacterium]